MTDCYGGRIRDLSGCGDPECDGLSCGFAPGVRGGHPPRAGGGYTTSGEPFFVIQTRGESRLFLYPGRITTLLPNPFNASELTRDEGAPDYLHIHSRGRRFPSRGDVAHVEEHP